MELLEFVSEKLKDCKTEEDYKAIIAFLISEHADIQEQYNKLVNTIIEIYGDQDAALVLDVANHIDEVNDIAFKTGKNGEELAVISKALAHKFLDNDVVIYEMFPEAQAKELKTHEDIDNAEIIGTDAKLLVLAGELLYKTITPDYTKEE